jgi:hypothetical protein
MQNGQSITIRGAPLLLDGTITKSNDATHFAGGHIACPSVFWHVIKISSIIIASSFGLNDFVSKDHRDQNKERFGSIQVHLTQKTKAGGG